MKPMRLPWTPRMVPHGALDLLRGCNITCKACYNSLPPSIKPFAQIERELQLLLSRRRLHTLTLTGGEATLHPRLREIVRLVRSKGVHPAIITNGLLVEKGLLSDLKQAGLEMIIVHIDSGQQRADLPPNPTPQDIDQLRRKKAEMIASAGLMAGLAATLYRSRPQETIDLVRLVLGSPHIHFLLAANCTRISLLKVLAGDLESGIRCLAADQADTDCLEDEAIEPHETMAVLRRELGLQPFGYLGSNLDPGDPRWVSYTVAVVHGPSGATLHRPLRSSWTERLAMPLIRLVSGRYPFLQRLSPGRFRGQLLLNAVTGGTAPGNLRILVESLKLGRDLRAKHLLFQSGGALTRDGRVVYCRHCPDATIRDGRLVPACLSDRFVFDDNGASRGDKGAP